jgi:hypothetical protein
MSEQQESIKTYQNYIETLKDLLDKISSMKFIFADKFRDLYHQICQEYSKI